MSNINCNAGHTFVFAGGEVPDGWPCQCGEVLCGAEADKDQRIEELEDGAKKRCANCDLRTELEMSEIYIDDLKAEIEGLKGVLIDIDACFEVEHYNCQDCKDKVKQALEL